MADISRKPNWSKWLQMPEWRLWEAVALSLGIDPGKVNKNPTAWMGAEHPFAENAEFVDRLEIVRRNAGRTDGIKLSAKNPSRWYLISFEATEFVAWTRRVGWTIPAEFASFGTERRRPRSDAGQWPWGTYQTQRLLALAAAVENFWTDYVPGKMRPHTTSGVAAWIREQYPNISTDQALSIARIIRPDNAPPGRPKTRRPA